MPKSLFRTILLLLYIYIPFTNNALGQSNKPNNSVTPGVNNGSVFKPSAYAVGVKPNYIRSWTALGPIINTSNLLNTEYFGVKQSTQYIDGLGRPLQIVERQASPMANDIVKPFVFDQFGHEQYKFIPFSSTTNNGVFKTDPFTAQATFYENQYPGESVLYNKINYEASPLGRIQKTMAPGNSWAGSNVGVEMQYFTNSSVDAVRRWSISNNALVYSNNDVATNIPTSTGTYADNELFKNVAKDESENVIVEYKDKEGRLILKKVQIGAIAADYSGYSGFLNTYYIYDEYSQLRFVLSPKAVEAIQSSWMLEGQTSIINELCFRYEYDTKGRMIAQKSPGAGWTYMIYDNIDRLVLSQSASLQNHNQWMATLYDELSRPVSTGIINYAGTPLSLQAFVDSKGIILSATDLPVGSNFIPLTFNYYDNYDWTTHSYSSANNGKLTAGENLHSEGMPLHASTSTKGLLTGHKVRIINDPSNLGGGGFLTTVNFFDEKERVIQTRSENICDNSYQVISYLYSFTGQVLCSYLEHHNPNATPSSLQIKSEFKFDHGGRLMKIWKTINDDGNSRVLITENKYREDGQLHTKKIGQQKEINGSYSSDPIESLEYSYNIRGWLTGINKDYANSLSGASSWFGMELNYDWGYEKNQVNGNIAGVKWRSKGDGERRSYGYNYDKAGRLLAGDFAQFEGSNFVDHANINFDVKIGDGDDPSTAYDANGNIKKMQQWGIKGFSSSQIDNLTYTYNANSNKLSNVADNISADNKLGDFTDKNTGTVDYGYDKSGNLVTDLNKNLNGATGIDLTAGGAIIYNLLNLPYLINVKKNDGISDQGSIKYIYDANGEKLQKIAVDLSVADKTITTTTSYLDGLIYESKKTVPTNTPDDDYSNRLLFVSHEEGRIRYIPENSTVTPIIPASFAFDYFVRDQLGNTRMVLAEKTESSAYPPATMEATRLNLEQNLYSINEGRVEALPIPVKNNYPGLEEKAYRVRGIEGEKTGLGIILKVMAGDAIYIKAESYYAPPAGGGNVGQSAALIASELLSAFSSGFGDLTKVGITESELINNTAISSATTGFLNDPARATASNVPKAYLNYVLFDEQLQYVSGGFDKVDQGGTGYRLHDRFISTPVEVQKNGFIFIYASNESDLKVLFDNIAVTHNKSRLLEETHYYPFGLTMVGISSKALNNIEENKFKFNKGSELQSKEFSDGTGLDWYDTHYRQLDVQLGRWNQLDPKPNRDESLYASMGNNPIMTNDPLGDTVIRGAGFWRNLWEGMKDGGIDTKVFLKSLTTVQGWKDMGQGFLHYADPSPVGHFLRVQAGEKVVDYVGNIPNMSLDQIGHDVGYGTEKLVENVVISKGVGFVKNAVSGGRLLSEVGILAKPATTTLDGSFSITELGWQGYPKGVPKPNGPFRLLTGEEYSAARSSANKANKALSRELQLTGKSVDIHEITPVKFGGSPTSVNNKVFLDRNFHQNQVTPWWNNLLISLR